MGIRMMSQETSGHEFTRCMTRLLGESQGALMFTPYVMYQSWHPTDIHTIRSGYTLMYACIALNGIHTRVQAHTQKKSLKTQSLYHGLFRIVIILQSATKSDTDIMRVEFSRNISWRGTALKIELAIELCVFVCARLPCLYWKQLQGKSYRVNVRPGAWRMCCSYAVATPT